MLLMCINAVNLNRSVRLSSTNRGFIVLGGPVDDSCTPNQRRRHVLMLLIGINAVNIC